MPEIQTATKEHSGAVTRCMPVRPVLVACRGACLVHIYPTGPVMGKRYELSTEKGLVIGRGVDCSIVIEDHSVSRKHARIELTSEGFVAEDLGSTNGTLVNNQPITRQVLQDGDYLRIGNCIYRFLAGGNVEAEYHEEIYRLAIFDGLTEIPNKRYLLEFLNRELARAIRYNRPLSLLLFDIDRFKQINDTYGHLCGDQVLHDMIAHLKTIIRADELLARYGGEEFAVVLPECTLDNACKVGERLREMVEQQVFLFEQQRIPVTISVGVASLPGNVTFTVSQLLEQADLKLYQAKNTGRNRVCG